MMYDEIKAVSAVVDGEEETPATPEEGTGTEEPSETVEEGGEAA